MLCAHRSLPTSHSSPFTPEKKGIDPKDEYIELLKKELQKAIKGKQQVEQELSSLNGGGMYPPTVDRGPIVENPPVLPDYVYQQLKREKDRIAQAAEQTEKKPIAKQQKAAEKPIEPVSQQQDAPPQKEMVSDEPTVETPTFYSEEIHEILTQVPNWMIRWGTTLMLFIFAGILGMSWMIKYPDVLTGKIVLNGEQPPAPVVAKTSGTLRLFRDEGTELNSGEVFGVINSATVFEDVKTLNRRLRNNKQKLSRGEVVNINGWNSLTLGQIQPAYNQLLTQIREQSNYQINAQDNRQRKESIAQQEGELRQQLRQKERDYRVLYDDYKFAVSNLENRYKGLYGDGVISAEQLEQYEQDVLQKQRMAANSKTAINEIKNRLIQVESQRNELDFSTEAKMRTQNNAIATAYSDLISTIKQWEEGYLLRSPADGHLQFGPYIKNTAFIQAGQELAQILTVTDVDKGLIGEILIPTTGAGRMEKGQIVNVVFDDYPQKEFGYVKAKVKDIAPIVTNLPNGGGSYYQVKAIFPKGLITTSHKELPFIYNMTGKADVITKDKRLLERIFEELSKVFEN